MASAAPPSYKAILLGDPCVGKSSLFLRLQKGVFVKTDELATIGVDYLEKDIDVGDKTIRVCSLLVRRVRSLIIVFFLSAVVCTRYRRRRKVPNAHCQLFPKRSSCHLSL